MNNKKLHALCARIMACDTIADVIKVLERFTRRLPQRKKRGTWGYNAQKLLDALRVDSVAFSIFVKGNGVNCRSTRFPRCQNTVVQVPVIVSSGAIPSALGGILQRFLGNCRILFC
jgi:hypothetical protein